MKTKQEIHFLLISILLFFSCYPIKNQKADNQYLPDLTVKTVNFNIHRKKSKTNDPNLPKRTILGDSIDIELEITIENIGSGNWQHDLCVQCILAENNRQDMHDFVFENLQISYASQKTITVNLKNLSSRPETITINLNPQNQDNLKQNCFCEENFYGNNSYKLDLKN